MAADVQYLRAYPYPANGGTMFQLTDFKNVAKRIKKSGKKQNAKKK